MNYTKKCQCEHTEYTITRWTIQFDYKYKIECTCGSFIQWATQKDVAMYNERYNKSMTLVNRPTDTRKYSLLSLSINAPFIQTH